MTIKPSKKSSTAKNEESGESQTHSAQNATNRSQNRTHALSIPSGHANGDISHYSTHGNTYEDHTASTSKRRVRCSPHHATNRCKLRSENKREREPRDTKNIAPGNSSPVPSCSEKETKTVRDQSGYNSGDEYTPRPEQRLTNDEWAARDKLFESHMNKRGLEIREMADDGACLFRAISDQVFGDQDMHSVVRQNTMDYIYQNRDYFAQYVTEDFNSYVNRKRHDNVHGNHVEIQAVSEMYNRPVEVYIYAAEPANVFNATEQNSGYEPIRLSYQRGSHYNSIRNPWKATVGIGLGLAGYHPGEADINQLNDAVKQSEDLLIEQTMLEDKLKATDWEATNEAIEEQVARESYLQWCKDNERRKKQSSSSAESSSTITSMELRSSPRSRTSGGPTSPHQYPHASSKHFSQCNQRKGSYLSHELSYQLTNHKDPIAVDAEIYETNGLMKEDNAQNKHNNQMYDPYLSRYVTPMPVFKVRCLETKLRLGKLSADCDENNKTQNGKGIKSFLPADIYEQRLTRSVSPQSKCERLSRNNSPSARSCDMPFDYKESNRLTRKNVMDLENALYEVMHNSAVITYKKNVQSNKYVQSDSTPYASDDEHRTQTHRKRSSTELKELISDDAMLKKRAVFCGANELNYNSEDYKKLDNTYARDVHDSDNRVMLKISREKARENFSRYGRRTSRGIVISEELVHDFDGESVSLQHNLRSRSVQFVSQKSQEKMHKKKVLRSPGHSNSSASSQQGSRSGSPHSICSLNSIQEDVLAPQPVVVPERTRTPEATTSRMSDFHRSLYEGLQAYESSRRSSGWGEADDLRVALAASELEYYAQLKRTHETTRQKHDPMAPSTSHTSL